jgi:hypothetical protein
MGPELGGRFGPGLPGARPWPEGARRMRSEPGGLSEFAERRFGPDGGGMRRIRSELAAARRIVSAAEGLRGFVPDFASVAEGLGGGPSSTVDSSIEFARSDLGVGIGAPTLDSKSEESERPDFASPSPEDAPSAPALAPSPSSEGPCSLSSSPATSASTPFALVSRFKPLGPAPASPP